MTELDAAEYFRRSSLQEAMAQEVLALLDLNGSERILDVGCGDGKITAQIASRASKGSVVGVDPSRDMISFARSHFGPATLPNLRFEVADAGQLPFKNEFDLVVLSMLYIGFRSNRPRLLPYTARWFRMARRSFVWYRKAHARAWRM